MLLSSKRKYSATSSKNSTTSCDKVNFLVRDLNLNRKEYDASNVDTGLDDDEVVGCAEGMSFSSRECSESASIPGLVTSQESVTSEEECGEGIDSEMLVGDMFTDDLVLVYKGNGAEENRVFKQVPEQGKNDYRVVMWAEVDTGHGKREESYDISSLYDEVPVTMVIENVRGPDCVIQA